MKPTISLVMIVKNEETTIQRCLESAFHLVDEIVIVDTGSTDNTINIAKKFGAVVYQFEWCDDFSAARNYGLEHSNCDWCLVLDADEYISSINDKEIQNFIENGPVIGRVKRIDEFVGPDGLNFERIYISRLFPSSCRYEGKIHEQISSVLPRVTINLVIKHDGYMGGSKNERNIPILMRELEENPRDPYYYFQIAKEYRGMENHESSFFYFKQAYEHITGKEGYAPCVVVNYLYAIMASGYLEEGIGIVENEPEYIRDYPDYYFASALFLLELLLINPDKYSHLLPYIEKYYKRAIDIGETEQEGSVVGTGSFAAHHNLGVFYEMTGDIQRAKKQYLEAAIYNYLPSIERLQVIN